MFCVVLNQVRNAPAAIASTVDGSPSARPVSGAFGFLMFRVSHPPARTRAATRPSTSGIRLVRLISRTLLRRSVRGSEADLHNARQRPEVGIRETVKPERVRVTREAGHLGVVPGVAREREQVASDHSHLDPAQRAQADLLQGAAADVVADVDLL